MNRASVCGAGSFIGGHLVKKLKREGYWVRGEDIKEHEFAPTNADEFLLYDLRDPHNCRMALTLPEGSFDDYQWPPTSVGWASSLWLSARRCATTPWSISTWPNTSAEMGVTR